LRNRQITGLLADPYGSGFAVGWDYAIGWLTVLPFELTAAGITIRFWREDINIGVWIAVFLFLLCVIQIFGVRGYGEGM
jgi:amino acid transporter